MNQGFSVFLYNEDNTILYHSSSSINALIRETGIHYSNVNKCIKNNELYLGTFRISLDFITSATKTNLSLEELNDFISQKRTDILKLNNNALPLFIYNTDFSVLYYSNISINAAVKDLNIHNSTILRCINNNSLFLNFFNFSNEVINEAVNSNMSLNDFKEFILAKRLEINPLYSKRVLGPSKGAIIVSVLFVNTGESMIMPSITETVNYLKEKGISLNGRTISKYLDSGIAYKDILFTTVKK